MIFDAVCTLVERYFPPMENRIRAAHLFVYDGAPCDFLPKEFPEEQRMFLSQNFFLPFNTVSIEDKASCTTLWNTERDQIGLEGLRGFFDVMPFTQEAFFACADGRAVDREHVAAQLAKYPPGTYSVAEGSVGPVILQEDGIFVHGTVMYVAMVTKEGGVLAAETAQKFKKEQYDFIAAPFLKAAKTALEELFFLNTPERFVVEMRPRRMGKARKGRLAKIPRTHQRPRYTLLRPTEIRKRFGLGEPGHGTPKTPHERRRHYRRYPDDPARWPQAHGRTVIIPAVWVGQSEGDQGNTHYRVMLDL